MQVLNKILHCLLLVSFLNFSTQRFDQPQSLFLLKTIFQAKLHFIPISIWNGRNLQKKK